MRHFVSYSRVRACHRWVALAESLLWLGLASAALRWNWWRKFHWPFPRAPRESSPPQALLWAMRVVATRLFTKSSCLTRALALQWALSCRGIPTHLRIGVRKEALGELLDAHAWLEWQGIPLNDSWERTRCYSPLEKLGP